MSEKICPIMSVRDYQAYKDGYISKVICQHEHCQWWWKCMERISEDKMQDMIMDILENGGHDNKTKTEFIIKELKEAHNAEDK